LGGPRLLRFVFEWRTPRSMWWVMMSHPSTFSGGMPMSWLVIRATPRGGRL